MGSQSKHLKPVSWTPSVCRDHRNSREPCVRSQPSPPRTQTDRRTERAIESSPSPSRSLPDCFRCERERHRRPAGRISDCPAALGPAEQLESASTVP